MRVRITHCVCYDKSFAELVARASECGVTEVAELQRHAQFGLNCGICLPYIRRALRSGQIEFDEVIEE